MVDGVPYDVHHRVADFVDDGAVEFGFLSLHDQFDFLAEGLGEVPHEAGEPFEDKGHGHHAELGHKLLDVPGNSAELGKGLVKLPEVRLLDQALDPCPPDHEFSDKVHELVQPSDVDPDGLAGFFCSLGFFLGLAGRGRSAPAGGMRFLFPAGPRGGSFLFRGFDGFRGRLRDAAFAADLADVCADNFTWLQPPGC